MTADFTTSYVSTLDGVSTNFSDRTALSLIDLKKQIITAFHAKQMFGPRSMRQATNSFAARFPASGKMGDPRYHSPGTRETGADTPPNRNYRDITLDDRLVLSLFLDEYDANARAVINFQPMFAMEMGQSMANFDDKNAAIVAVLAARTSATVSGGDGGNQTTKANVDTNVGALNAALWDVKNKYDELSVPEFMRYLGLRPAQYNLFAATFNRIFSRELGQSGSIGQDPILPPYAGFEEIFMSNNIPSTNIASSPTGSRNTYNGDFTNTVGIAFQAGAFGTVVTGANLSMGGSSQPNFSQDPASKEQLLDIREVKIPEAFGTLYLTSLITGHGVLNPVCANEILKS